MFAAGREDMQQMDKYTIEVLGLPGAVLMENAGARVADELLAMDADSFVVLAGSGNNGGDGFVIARRLIDAGKDCKLVLAANPERIKADAKIHFDVYLNRSLPVIYANEETMGEVESLLRQADVTVDALLGTGTKGSVREPARSVIESADELAKFIVAVDIPSGVDSDTGGVADLAVKADRTITFVAPKKGFFLQQGPQHTGSWEAVDISVPPSVADELNLHLPQVITEEFAVACLPERPAHGHKGTFGHVLVTGGSKPYVGAPLFTAKATLYAGAGLVTLGVPEGVYPMAAAQMPEALFWPMNEMDGRIAADSLEEHSMDAFDVIAVGPGMSRFDEGEAWLETLFEKLSGQPVVVDADALFHSKGILEKISRYEGDVFFTPHPGEMATLLGTTVKEVEADRLGVAERFAKEHGIYLLLKGHRSVIATPEGDLYINPAGSAALGKGGSGDVLTGLIASFIAQGAAPEDAMIAAAFLHAKAGEQQAENLSSYGVTPLDLMEGCRKLLQKWTG